MGSTKGSLVTEGKFNEKPSKFYKNAVYQNKQIEITFFKRYQEKKSGDKGGGKIQANKGRNVKNQVEVLKEGDEKEEVR